MKGISRLKNQFV